MKNFLQISSFLFLLLILSCSGSDENSGEDQANQYIDLFVSGTEGFIGETIIFSVFGVFLACVGVFWRNFAVGNLSAFFDNWLRTHGV